MAIGEGTYAQIFKAIPSPCILVAGDGRIVSFNPAAAKRFGLTAEHTSIFSIFSEEGSALSTSLRRSSGVSSWLPTSAVVAEGDMAGSRHPLKIRLVEARGHHRLILILAQSDENSPFAQHTELIRKLNRELAVQQELERKLQMKVEHEKYLHRELIHRVKNNLSLLAGLIRLKMRDMQSDEAREAMAEIALRTRAISLVHELLDRNNAVEIVDAGELVGELCKLMQTSLLPSHVELECDVEALELHNEDATTLCLLINELVTNSIKHAFVGQARGRIELKFMKNGVDKIELRVRDDGRGPSGAEPPRQAAGHGTQILYALAKDLKGELLQNAEEGTEWTLIFDPKEPTAVAAE